METFSFSYRFFKLEHRPVQQAPALPVQVPTVGQEPSHGDGHAPPPPFPRWPPLVIVSGVNVVSEADAALIALTVSGSEAETSIDLPVTVASGSNCSLPSPFPSGSSPLSPSPASGAGEECASHTDERAGCLAVSDEGLGRGKKLRNAPPAPFLFGTPLPRGLRPSHLPVFPFVMGNVYRSSPYQADGAHKSQGQGLTGSRAHGSLLCAPFSSDGEER